MKGNKTFGTRHRNRLRHRVAHGCSLVRRKWSSLSSRTARNRIATRVNMLPGIFRAFRDRPPPKFMEELEAAMLTVCSCGPLRSSSASTTAAAATAPAAATTATTR